MSHHEQRSRDYPVKENMPWQRFEWRLQLIGYLVLLLLVLAGACGAFSKGFLSNRQVSSPDGRIQLDYERFGRRDSNMDWSFHLHKLQGDHYQLTLSGPRLDDLQIQTLQPQPDESWSEDNSLVLRWHRRSEQHDATIWLSAQPQNYGNFPLNIRLDDSRQLKVNSLIYP